MAATLSRSPPMLDPPTSALPPLPTVQSQKNSVSPSDYLRTPSKLYTASKLAVRTPSTSGLPTALLIPRHVVSTPEVPTLRSTSNAATREASLASKEVRRSVSIAAFPRPPKSNFRIPTPSGRPSLGRFGSPSPLGEGQQESGGLNSPTTSARGLKPKILKASNEASGQIYPLSNPPPTLLNGSGDGKSISPGGSGTRGSIGRLSMPSPTHSRSSSAQGSYSTSATTFEDVDESAKRGREEVGDSTKRATANEGKGNVVVSVRVRPDASGSGDSKTEGEWMVDGRRSLVAYRGREGGDYYYDNVFATHDKNDRVYDASAKRLVRRVMDGYHGTVFAYGTTGTGKTFSMQGTTTSPGVIPLAITDIFSYIRETPHREFLLRVSYLEIYNEKIHDLLSPPAAGGPGIGPGAPQQEEIKLREDSKRGVYASPLREEIVQSPTQLLRVIARGDHARRTSSTQYNARSSRSHAVVQIVVESRERIALRGSSHQTKRAAIAPGGVRVSTLSLIDLAGSERAAENKERRTEGAHINKSLLTLGTVIARLSGDKDKNGDPTDKDGKHLPYRDSKLTRLLQPALSGDSLISILCTIQIGSAGSAAATSGHTAETLNTLKFAARAKNNIVSHAKKAEESLGSGVDNGSRALLEKYRMEIQNLRAQLDGQVKVQYEREEKQLEKEATQRHAEQILEMQLARTALKERIEHLSRLVISSQSIGVNSYGSFSPLNMYPRLPVFTNADTSSKSARSSGSHSTLGPASPPLNRTTSRGSSATVDAELCNGQSPASSFEKGVEEFDTRGDLGDGTASLSVQNRALQADLADKNRYISTLEKRLLQARRSSHSRASLVFSPSQKASHVFGDDQLASVLQEKDDEITDLRARLDDKDRMLTALRSAARKRDVAELSPEASPVGSDKQAGHRSSDGKSGAALQAGPVGLVESMSPPEEQDTERNMDDDDNSNSNNDSSRKSVDEMSRILDEMIQDRVESGQLVKGTRGSVRLAPGRRKAALHVGAMAVSLRPPSEEM